VISFMLVLLAGYISINSTNSCTSSGYCTTTDEIQVNGTNGGNSGCFLNGTYNLTFDIACNPLWTNDCPLQGNTAQIIFDLSSGNLCGVFTAQVNISATLNTYASAGALVTQETFLENQIIYMNASVTSTEVSLVSTYVLNCSSIFEPTGISTLLYSGGSSSANSGSITADATAASFTFTYNDAVTATFQLVATSQLFPVATDSFSSAVISCWIGVDYQDVTVKRTSIKEITTYYSSKSNLKKLSGNIFKRQSNSQHATSADARFAVVQVASQNQPTQEISGANNSQSITILMSAIFVVLAVLIM